MNNTRITPYELGQKFQYGFDYDGMMKMGTEAALVTGLEELKLLHNSFESVNYHTEGSILSLAIECYELNQFDEAIDYLFQFNGLCEGKVDNKRPTFIS